MLLGRLPVLLVEDPRLHHDPSEQSGEHDHVHNEQQRREASAAAINLVIDLEHEKQAGVEREELCDLGSGEDPVVLPEGVSGQNQPNG